MQKDRTTSVYVLSIFMHFLLANRNLSISNVSKISSTPLIDNALECYCFIWRSSESISTFQCQEGGESAIESLQQLNILAIYARNTVVKPPEVTDFCQLIYGQQ